MNMNRLSELDTYWIAERYHSAPKRDEFVECLHSYKVPRDDGILIWKLIDAAIDIAPQNIGAPAEQTGNNRSHVIALRKDVENVVRGLDGSEKIDDIVNRIMDRIAQRTGVR